VFFPTSAGFTARGSEEILEGFEELKVAENELQKIRAELKYKEEARTDKR
jgi:hypothetical protein